MPSQPALIWAGATGAAVAAVGAAALIWTHPGSLRPNPPPVVATGPAEPASQPPASEAAPAPQSNAAAPPQEAKPAEVKPAFDVVSVEPSGDTVVAGRAAPNVKVALLDGPRTLAEAMTDAQGQFVMIPAPLPPGEHSLTLSAGSGGASETSAAIPVTVAAPPPLKSAAQEATPSPAPPSAAPGAPSSAAPAAPAAVAIDSVEASAEGGMVAKGAAEPNATVRLYLGGAYVGDAKTKDDGRWSLTIAHGLSPGPYTVRADEIGRDDAKVVARAEAPFTFPANLAPAAVARAQAALPAASPSDLVLDSVQTHHVERGHTLWGISQRFYGDGSRYAIIFHANSSQIRDPNLIYPGQTFVVPKAASKP